MPSRLTPAQKIAKAKRLLVEATLELRQSHNREVRAATCECGHRRDGHVVTTSINYTGGHCMTCKCRWFMQTAAK